MSNRIRSLIVSPLVLISCVLPLAHASTCEVKLENPLSLEDGSVKIKKYEKLDQEVKECIDSFKAAQGYSKAMLLKSIEKLQTDISNNESELEKYKATLEKDQQKVPDEIDENLKTLAESKSAVHSARVITLNNALNQITGFEITLKTCLGAHELSSKSQNDSGKIIWNTYEDTDKHVDKCIDPAGADYFADAPALQDQLYRIKDLLTFYNKIEDRLSDLDKDKTYVENRNDDDENSSFKNSVEKLQSIKSKISKTLLAGQALWLSDIRVLAQTGDCEGVIPVIDDASQTDKYLNQIKTYTSNCKVAIQKAIQNNDSSRLGLLRDNIDTSIKNIDISTKALASFSDLNSNEADKIEIVSKALGLSRGAQNQIDELEKLSGKGSDLPLLANWRSDPFTNQFYFGLESSNVEGFSQNANARVGMLAYLRPGKKLVVAREIILSCHEKNKNSLVNSCGILPGFWPHWYLKADYSSAGEVSQQANPNEEKEPVDTSVAWESGFFWPLYYGARSGHNEDGIINPLKSEFMFGFLYSRGARDISNDGFRNRYYRGVRMAFNEETYFDILEGYSEGIEEPSGNLNKRWEIRVQYPVSKFGLGRVFVGGNVNFGHNDKDFEENKDAYTVYVMWQTSFDDLWTRAKPEE